MFQQYAMKFRAHDSYAVADYIAAPGLQEVWSLIHMQAPLMYIQGQKASGKTHLAHIFCQSHQGQFLQGGDFLAWEQISTAAALALDDCDHVHDPHLLFHLVNHAKDVGMRLLFTSRLGIADFPHQLPDLTSRLRGGMFAQIPQPDEMLLRGILLKRFADHQVRFQPDVLDYVSRRIPRDYSFLDDLFDELMNALSQHPRNLTLPLVRDVMARLGG